jgi:REP-associated tyrosine transposase
LRVGGRSAPCGFFSRAMARRPREETEGGIFHVFARGNRRQRIYLDDSDRKRYLRLLRSVVTDYGWRCLAYCLMENHVHLLVETPGQNLADGMQRLHGLYAASFNARHRLVGHLFQGRYGAVRVKSDPQLWSVVRYLALNPVEAGLCGLPDDWPWSSHAATAGADAPEWLDIGRLLSHFAAAGGEPRRRYEQFVGDARNSD